MRALFPFGLLLGSVCSTAILVLGLTDAQEAMLSVPGALVISAVLAVLIDNLPRAAVQPSFEDRADGFELRWTRGFATGDLIAGLVGAEVGWALPALGLLEPIEALGDASLAGLLLAVSGFAAWNLLANRAFTVELRGRVLRVPGRSIVLEHPQFRVTESDLWILDAGGSTCVHAPRSVTGPLEQRLRALQPAPGDVRDVPAAVLALREH